MVKRNEMTGEDLINSSINTEQNKIQHPMELNLRLMKRIDELTSSINKFEKSSKESADGMYKMAKTAIIVAILAVIVTIILAIIGWWIEAGIIPVQ